MRVLIVHQFFYPDHSAVSQLMTDLAESLVERGVSVTAVAGRGTYNGGARLSRRETHNGITIERAWTTSFGKSTLRGRLCDYLSFYVGAAWKLMRVPRHEILMVLTQPPLIGLIGLFVGRLRRMRVVELVQDIYPDVAVAVGAVRPDSFSTRFLHWLNRRSLGAMDRIIVLSECMHHRIKAKIGAERAGRIDIIHNWADGRAIVPRVTGEPNRFLDDHGLRGRFVVMFSGNFGVVNEFQTVLQAALILREHSEIIFVLIGDGVRKDEIRQFVVSNQLENILMLPYQPRGDLRQSLTAGDAHLVTLADGLAGLSVPSKTYAILAAGRPILFVGDAHSTIAKLIAEHRCGSVVPTGDSEMLAIIISEWAARPAQLDEMSFNARSLFESSFERQRAVTAYLESFDRCLHADAPELKQSELARTES
jgi:colanic acid biosynthesis glycosyl transferase WcaI